MCRRAARGRVRLADLQRESEAFLPGLVSGPPAADLYEEEEEDEGTKSACSLSSSLTSLECLTSVLFVLSSRAPPGARRPALGGAYGRTLT